MLYDMTARVAEAWDYYDRLLDRKIERIANLAGVEPGRLIKINPADFIERNELQLIRGYEFRRIKDFINENKKDDTFLISPLDEDVETAEQISYKMHQHVREKVRASKCAVLPVPRGPALDFFIRNHRQGPPAFRTTAVCLGLVKGGELLAVMQYDISDGAVRGKNKNYELVRLAIRKGTQVHGGASKLQKACEDTLAAMGVRRIFSYSNATINTGGVYQQLGFDGSKIDRGQPFVIMEDNRLERLISLFPASTNKELARRGRFETHVGGNRVWTKEIGGGTEDGKSD